jgi:uncharacterized protein involved in exopolysaccharide biosynthesis
VQNTNYSLQDLAGLIRRRGYLVPTTILTVILLSLVIAYSIPSLYRSAGTIVIEKPEVSDKFLPGTYQISDREQRIARINDEVMTRDNLAKIVEKHNLYPEERGEGPATSVVSLLRRNVELELILGQDDPRNRNAGDVSGFQIAYFHSEPTLAKNVARDIVDLFLEVNKQRRQAAYLETAEALEREALNQRMEVSRLEGLMADFKTENPGALPEDRNYNRSVIERKARDLDGLDREIRSLQDRKTMLQSQLAQTNPWMAAVGPNGEPLPGSNDGIQKLHAEYMRLIGNYSANHPDVLRVRREIEALSGGTASPAFRLSLESALAAKRAELSDAQILYGANHPDVQNLQRSVSALEDQIAELPSESVAAPEPNNPAYVNLELQLQGVNNELVALRADRQQLQTQTVELDRQVQIAPEVERRYLELTRDLGLARQQYEDTKSRQMDVERAGFLEEEELTERYVVAQIPSQPYEPAFPNRPLFAIIGAFLGVTLGVGAGIIAEALDGSIRSTRDIQVILGGPPIGAIPQIYSNRELRRVKVKKFFSIALGVVAIACVSIYVQLQRNGAI